MKRIVVTRPRAQAGPLAGFLEAEGFEPVFFPAIRIAPAEDPGPLNAALQDPIGFDWIVFTSANAVDAVWDRLGRLGRLFPAGARVAAVGPKTAASLSARGVKIDFVPGEAASRAIVPGLGGLAGKRVLLPLGDLATPDLAAAVAAAGGTPVPVIAYRTLPADPDPDGLAALRAGVDAVAFTSGSSAANFAALVSAAGLDPFRLPNDPLIVCIGPTTAAAARRSGFRVDRVAAEYTAEGLARSLAAAVRKGRRAEPEAGQ